MVHPNIVIIMTDQQRADLCGREGYPLDTMPFVDRLAAEGTWFSRAYTASPACAPARVSMLTGRFPSATRVRTNHNVPDACYTQDLVDVLQGAGYATALCGKNHSHLAPDRMNYWFHASHGGQEGKGGTDTEKELDQWLVSLHHRTSMEPTPFPAEFQPACRNVTHALDWIDTVNDKPFFLWLSFAEPHNPYQVPEPYFSLFPPETLPALRSRPDDWRKRGFKYEFVHWEGSQAFPEYDQQLPRARSNYHGMLRLIDDQVRRFVTGLDERGVRENTVILFLADHGDFAGEYGLVRKGPEVPEVLMRIPMVWTGPGIRTPDGPHPAHVSIVDVMPTLCDMLGAPLPEGVQGRSLWPLLQGGRYPEEEFASVFGEQGFGGLHYDAIEGQPTRPDKDGLKAGISYDCLNSWTQSGTMRMLRKGAWKLVFDMLGHGQLYNLDTDPAELDNRFDQPDTARVQAELTAAMLTWTLRVQDPLPVPRNRYVMKNDPRNWWEPYRMGNG